ncbi:transcriptional regulator domain protein [Mycobacterium ulcerans str. Harvey]|uniref:Transcriptional regulator domain protein n=1 Tax=Mycobacterium ulcerans str. Harvey TaxID=1299332 RepID=A0ABP3ACW3_MYCUL|nr:transcriptional regulator domain protein [Mycobacterium ulcerans str. Harvey]
MGGNLIDLAVGAERAQRRVDPNVLPGEPFDDEAAPLDLVEY